MYNSSFELKGRKPSFDQKREGGKSPPPTFRTDFSAGYFFQNASISSRVLPLVSGTIRQTKRSTAIAP